ncbi:hypothetical protein Nepgr_015291 [Nepenthes gracilis]|uniref:DUF4408 domain-containing protein n=1 Tax=Nepenthes gracilis TaxID=150966 RepID=A0AAD3SMN1_NEPGR|nr:hypothetical protein Nepgr_015291 [Nepenthes gracilis]
MLCDHSIRGKLQAISYFVLQMRSQRGNHVRSEKVNAFLRYNQLRKITNFFRVIEIFLFLTMISRFSFQLSVALKHFGKYFHGLWVMLVGPHFVFIVGNAIVIVLFTKSGHFSLRSPPNQAETEISEQEYKQQHGKQRTAEESTVIANIFPTSEGKIYSRSQPGKIRCALCKKNCCEIGRWEQMRQHFDYCQKTGEAHYPEDHMTSEEFRQKIEAFIARQQRFLREEEFQLKQL